MELTLKEKFVILAYEPVKGTNLATNFIGYGICGAMLLELAAMKKIKIENGRIKLVDGKRTDDEMLNKLLEILNKASRPMKVRMLMSKINQGLSRYKKPIIEGLIKKHYLRLERKRFLVFKYNTYPSANRSYRKDLVEYVRRFILRKAPSDADVALLAGLAGACKFASKFFDTKEDRKLAKKRIAELVKNNEIDHAIDETIRAVQSAVLASVVVTTAASTGSH